MRIKNLLVGLSGLALVAAPVTASANPASSLSIGSSVRASSDKGESKFSAPGGVIGAILFAAIIAGGVWLAVDDDNSDSN